MAPAQKRCASLADKLKTLLLFTLGIYSLKGTRIFRVDICHNIQNIKKKDMTSPNIAKIAEHYKSCWDLPGEAVEWKQGPRWQLPSGFIILVFKPHDQRKMWTYATCGMSEQGDAPPLELHLFAPFETSAHAELLTAIAHYHVTGAYLDLGHTVNFGRPWLPQSKLDHGFISLPYLDGPKLEWSQTLPRKTRFLWLIPITASEVAFKKAQGIEALECRLEEKSFNYLDPLRVSVA